MLGITVFKSVAEAIRSGFSIYDRTEYGYLVRARINGRFALAIVDLR